MKQSNRPLLIALLVSTLWLSGQVQAETLEGVIWGVDQESRTINLEDNHFPLSPGVKIYNLAGGSSALRNLEKQQHVRVNINEDGTVADIWVFPSDREKRWSLGYGKHEQNH